MEATAGGIQQQPGMAHESSYCGSCGNTPCICTIDSSEQDAHRQQSGTFSLTSFELDVITVDVLRNITSFRRGMEERPKLAKTFQSAIDVRERLLVKLGVDI